MTIPRSTAGQQSEGLPPPVFGLILAGGRSSRMKEDKALIKVGGRTQAQRTFDLLEEHCYGAFLSCRPDQIDLPGYADLPQIPDVYPDAGPMGGMLSAFRLCPGAAWLVAACDLPFLDPDTVAHLLLNRNTEKLATAFRSVHDGLPEPLCTVYEPTIEPELRRFLSTGLECPRKALIRLEGRVELLGAINRKALDNMNTPEDLRQLRKIFSAE